MVSSAAQPSLPLSNSFWGAEENRLHFVLLRCMFNMHVFEPTLTKLWFQSSSDSCKFRLSASPGPSCWLSARGLCGELALGADPAA